MISMQQLLLRLAAGRLSVSSTVGPTLEQGCSPKKEVGGRLKPDLDKDF